MDRPKLTDPKEWAIVRAMYFDTTGFTRNDIDPLEAFDRMSRKKTKNNAR